MSTLSQHGSRIEIKVEILAIGNELCCGRIYDTNSYWIADQVTQLGAIVRRITCVPDIIEDICDALRNAIDHKVDFIISTGGLGPTLDDITVEALAKVLGVDIENDEKILHTMAKRRGVKTGELPPNLIKMTRSLKGGVCFPNPLGWAPITMFKYGETVIFALPGPPMEVKACFSKYIADEIGGKTPYRSMASRILVTMFESQVTTLTNSIMEKRPGIYLKPLVGKYCKDIGLPVDIVVFAKDEKTCKLKMQKAITELRESITLKGYSLKKIAE
jgi:nicotinamide-nucleotide amidase